MRNFILIATMILTGCQYFSYEELPCSKKIISNHKIKIENLSTKPLVCYKADYVKDDWELTNSFEVSPESSLNLKMCSYRDRYACSFSTEHESSTFLTWFTPYISGEYKASLQEVPCNKCSPTKFRKATVIEFPNGEKEQGSQ